MIEKCSDCGSDNVDEYGCLDCFRREAVRLAMERLEQREEVGA